MGRAPLLAAALCCALTWLPAAADTAYETRFAEALALERQGDHRAALDTLDDLEGVFPQDYPLMLQLGWLAYSAGDLDRAEQYYTQAASLSGGSDETRRGLEAVASRRRVHGHAHASLLGSGYPAIGERTWGLGLVVGGSLQWRQLVGELTYRLGRFSSATPSQMSPGTPPGVPTGGLQVDSFTQHELYLAGGTSTPSFGVTGHYALLHETSGTLGTAHVIGAAARFSPLGHVTAEASLSMYTDATIFRASAGWQLPLGRGLWLRPGGSVQVVDDTVLGAGHLDVGYADHRGEIWLGGKGGAEYRPVYLTDTATYNILETIPWGAHLGGSVYLTDRWSLTATFEAYGAQATEDEGADHVGLVGSLGASIDF